MFPLSMTLLLASASVCATLQQLPLNMPLGGDDQSRVCNELNRRAATKNDLDEITKIVNASFKYEPEVNYRFPYRDKYPEDYAKWTRKEYEGYLDQPSKYVLHVVECETESDGEAKMQPIALAVWDTAVLTKANKTCQGIDERRDVNKKHWELFRNASSQRFLTYFAPWSDQQIYLNILMTHPDYRRRGAGSMLTDWGIDFARNKSWPVTVAASPMGRLLYAHLGFEDIAKEVIQADGEDEKVTTTMMVRHTENERTR